MRRGWGGCGWGQGVWWVERWGKGIVWGWQFSCGRVVLETSMKEEFGVVFRVVSGLDSVSRVCQCGDSAQRIVYKNNFERVLY